MTVVTVGIDIGSLATKVVLLKDGTILDYVIERSRHSFKERAKELVDEMLQKQGLVMKDVSSILGTGYGRHSIKDIYGQAPVTEITAHAKGVNYFIPNAKTVIDMGGQDTKVILLGKGGKVLDFQMNDKCAAGTGRFLEVMAKTLDVELDYLGDLDAKSTKEVTISSTCTVFAESEVISLIASGESKPNIIHGLHRAIASRVNGMVRRMGVIPDVVFCGGVAKNQGMVRALEKELSSKIHLPKDPQITGALGSAIIAAERLPPGN
ncbi:MAG: 2-hydroxyglutaryl-CoA dehydratase [Candidatus Lokiarchaeota archaeon]|nr:2-hydroxyglutaryl-CoA dehydratase [Candidatus Lokiarchaeota archaeon]